MGTTIIFWGGAVVTAAIIDGTGKVVATGVSNTRSRALTKAIDAAGSATARAHTRTLANRTATRFVRDLGRLSA